MRQSAANMQTSPYYSEQFSVTPDLFHVTIPQHEIIEQMSERGDHQVLNEICLAVAIVADALAVANTTTA